MVTCGTCWREFPAGFGSRQQHFNATGHRQPDFECDTCDYFFDNQQEVNQHMTARNHWHGPHHECEHCNFDFRTQEDLRLHEVHSHLYCSPCNRYFQNANNIHAHLHSSVHRTSKVRCMFCGTEHGTATGLVHHLESGRCPKAPLNRDKLYQAVRSRDPTGLISKKLLGWSGSPSYEASEKAWNPSAQAFQCYLCGRLFGQLKSLNQHLSSPAHQQKLYHCPNGRCDKEFVTLAALINHLESESCKFMRFDAVQRNVAQILDPRRMIQG